MSSVVSVLRDAGLSGTPLPKAPFDPPNPVYDAVASVLAQGGWPRLEGVVRPGMRVLIKPNFVTDRYFQERLLDARLLACSTHASVIRPLVDFALEQGAAEVIVADTPIEGCDLEPVLAGLGFTSMINALQGRGLPVRFLDLRPFRIVPLMALDDMRGAGRSWNLGLLVRRELPGDPEGYVTVDLGGRSRFAEIEERSERLRFHRANPTTPVPHHSGGRHEYGIPKTALTSDLVIHVPKLKTHKKSGVTLSLKSSIGLCGYKYWLPHYTGGSPPLGDEFPHEPSNTQRWQARLSRMPVPGGHSLVARAPRVNAEIPTTEGSWEGNDTVWRTTLDLATILTHAAADGSINPAPCRATFALIDGIIGGEGEGPFGVTPVPTGMLIAGTDPALVDVVGARAMGYDENRIPTLRRALRPALLPSSDLSKLDVRWAGPAPDHRFTPPRAWPSLREDAAPAAAASDPIGELWAG